MPKPRMTLVIDPRFSGGTSAAVAQELTALKDIVCLNVVGISSKMFKGDDVRNPNLVSALRAAGLDVTWDPKIVSSEIIVLHNPSFLKFETELSTRFVCEHLIVVSHENFSNPTGIEPFNVDDCMQLLDDASLCSRKTIAPVSSYNRKTVQNWLASAETDWQISRKNWFNICEFTMQRPTSTPRDRRGRHSRPGLEKFPDLPTLQAMFPPHAEAVTILGADTLREADTPAHWTLYDFRAIPVKDLLDRLDFFVYFTNPGWRESFGRVLAEAIAAGKLVITDPDTAANIGPGPVGAAPKDVDTLIRNYIQNPQEYQKDVLKAQKTISAYSADAFRTTVEDILQANGEMA